MATVWIHDSEPLRQVSRTTPRGTASCEDCGKDLDYEYGSIRWSYLDRDQCGRCAGSTLASQTLRDIRDILEQQP